MKQEDFERLKAVCEKEGFELLKSLPDKDTNFHILAVSKRDIWDGVEFAECVAFADIHGKTNGFLTFGKIYRVSNIVSGSTDCHIINDWGYEGNCMLDLLKPSTEQAYIEQLKKEAHERFGEIKEGDRFDRSKMEFNIPQDVDRIFGANNGFKYYKDYDQFFFGNTAIYNQGKWATRVKERVKVEFGWTEKKIASMKTPVALFTNKSTEKSIFDGKTSNEICDIFTFLAKQLEKYLNGEVE